MRQIEQLGGEPPVRAIGRTRVALGIRDLPFHHEVLDFLEREPLIEILGAAAGPDSVRALIRTPSVDALVLCPDSAAAVTAPAGDRPPCVLVDHELTIPVLRRAIDCGAQAVFCWPDERSDLVATLVRMSGARRAPGSRRGRVLAVYGARGGIGTTFVATHLAAALSDRGLRAVLVDLGADLGETTLALGIGAVEATHTIADLVGVMGELSPEHLHDALFSHPRGFAALLPPPEPSVGAEVPAGLYAACVALLATGFDAVVLHVPRGSGEAARRVLAMADRVVVLTGLDAFSVYGARRAMAAFGLQDHPDRCEVVVSRAGRAELSSADVARILSKRPAATIRADRRVAASQQRGELLPRGARGAARDVALLADRLIPSDSGPGSADRGSPTPGPGEGSRSPGWHPSQRHGSGQGSEGDLPA